MIVKPRRRSLKTLMIATMLRPERRDGFRLWPQPHFPLRQKGLHAGGPEHCHKLKAGVAGIRKDQVSSMSNDSCRLDGMIDSSLVTIFANWRPSREARLGKPVHGLRSEGKADKFIRRP
jgi:hypothetical protein